MRGKEESFHIPGDEATTPLSRLARKGLRVGLWPGKGARPPHGLPSPVALVSHSRCCQGTGGKQGRYKQDRVTKVKEEN